MPWATPTARSATYWDAFWAEPGLQGGFVWDWIDQGLLEYDDQGRPFWAYDGHFGPASGDANFCINGLIGPDRTPHPGLRELKWCARPVRMQVPDDRPDGRRVVVTNRRSFATTDDLRFAWILSEDGVERARGELEVPTLKPGESRRVPVRGLPQRLGREARLEVQARQRRRTPWAAAGHLVAWEQFLLDAPVTTAATRSPTTVDGTVEADRFELHTGPVAVTGATSTGTMAAITVAGRPVVIGDITPTLWRAPIDNDGVSQGWMAAVSGQRPRWLAWGLDRLQFQVEEVSVRRRGDTWTVRRQSRLVGAQTGARCDLRLTVGPAGVAIDQRIVVPEQWDDVPRVGLRFPVSPDFDRLRWYGLGPDETYADRRGAATVGVWRQPVAEQYHPYVVPQEHGAHYDTRWFDLRERSGQGLRFEAAGSGPIDRSPAMIFSARTHTDAALTSAHTVAELESADHIEVHIDAAIARIGDRRLWARCAGAPSGGTGPIPRPVPGGCGGAVKVGQAMTPRTFRSTTVSQSRPSSSVRMLSPFSLRRGARRGWAASPSNGTGTVTSRKATPSADSSSMT